MNIQSRVLSPQLTPILSHTFSACSFQMPSALLVHVYTSVFPTVCVYPFRPSWFDNINCICHVTAGASLRPVNSLLHQSIPSAPCSQAPAALVLSLIMSHVSHPVLRWESSGFISMLITFIKWSPLPLHSPETILILSNVPNWDKHAVEFCFLPCTRKGIW
jgi:hypothetical protein